MRAMQAVDERTLELGGFRTRALVAAPEGDALGDPFVLLHGWSDSADTWRPLLRRLADLRRPAIALDMPGFGRADRLDRERDVLPQLDAFVAAAVERESAESGGRGIVVVGNSLGGCAALRAAEDRRLPVAGVVPIAPAGLDMAGWFAIIESAPLVRLILRAPVPLPEVVVRDAVGRAYAGLAYARPREVDPAVVRGFTRHVRTRRDVIRVLATGRRLLPEIRDPFRLERVRCPVLLVWGDRDRMVYPSGAERVLREVPDARLEMVESCGHCPQVEATDRIVELLEAFTAPHRAAA